MARSASIWILCFGAWTKSGPNTTLVDILRGIDRVTFLQKSEKKCSKRGPKTGSDLEQLSFANRNLWGLLFRTVDKFWEFYRRVREPVRSACTPRWNSLKVRTDGPTDGRTFQFEAPGKEISASRNKLSGHAEFIWTWKGMITSAVCRFVSQ